MIIFSPQIKNQKQLTVVCKTSVTVFSVSSSASISLSVVVVVVVDVVVEVVVVLVVVLVVVVLVVVVEVVVGVVSVIVVSSLMHHPSKAFHWHPCSWLHSQSMRLFPAPKGHSREHSHMPAWPRMHS